MSGVTFLFFHSQSFLVWVRYLSQWCEFLHGRSSHNSAVRTPVPSRSQKKRFGLYPLPWIVFVASVLSGGSLNFDCSMTTFVSGSFFAQSSFLLLFCLSLQYVVRRRQSYHPHFIGGEAKSWSCTEVRPRLSQCAMAVKENLPSSLHQL